MVDALVLAYLGGLVDGDGYFKITKNYRTPTIMHPYYASVVGLSQLWPGPAVHLFAAVFGGEVKAVATRNGTSMARCELRGRRAESATRRLLPFLLVKRVQAILFLEVSRVRPKRRGRTPPSEAGHERVEVIAGALSRLHEGRWSSAERLPISRDMASFEGLSPAHFGWSREETSAYLAGIMDSDGNFRILRKKGRRMRWAYYQVNIRCAQVKPSPAIELLSQTFGGPVTTKAERRPRHRDLLSWGLHDKAAVAAIEELLPYLRVKSQDAWLLLQLRELKSHGKRDLTEWQHRTRWQRVIRMRKRSYSEDQVAAFERVRQSLLELHRCKSKSQPSGP